MSTRAHLARPTGGDGADGQWEGVYVHSDGYPTYTGRVLYQQVRHHYGVDLARAWRELIYAHPTGYSSLSDHPDGNDCYCHSRGEGINPNAKLETQEAASGYDYSYVLAADGLHIHHWDYGLLCVVPWDFPGEPPWQDIERAAHDMARSHDQGVADPGPYLSLTIGPKATPRKEITP